jgi:hypothetical protein
MNATVSSAVIATADRDRSHKTRLLVAWFMAVVLIVGLAIYGFDYYRLGSTARPFSPKHALLRPSGLIGLKLGFLGLGMFLTIFLYPLRKKWGWLSRQGSARHWLDFHVVLGVSAPFVIAFHSAFKFHGFAGIAFWIMLSVSLSGLVGRYLYSQIPRRVNAAEISMTELQDMQIHLSEQLRQQKLLPEAGLRSLLKLPSKETVSRLPLPVALVYMMILDVARVFRIAAIRRHALPFGQKLTTLAGFLATNNVSLERAISLAREEASLAKRVLFLSRSQQVFHLWHVVHKPFSYSFAVLAVIHIVVVMMMGYF